MNELIPQLEIGAPFNLSATGDVGEASQDFILIGFYVNSTNSGTLVLRSGGGSGTVISGTITPAVGFHRYPASCKDGLHATIGGTALDVTFFGIQR